MALGAQPGGLIATSLSRRHLAAFGRCFPRHSPRLDAGVVAAAAASDPNLLKLMWQRDLAVEYRVSVAHQALPFAQAGA